MDTTTSASIVADRGDRHGTTDYIARLIAAETGADIISISSQKKYSADFKTVVQENEREAFRRIFVTRQVTEGASSWTSRESSGATSTESRGRGSNFTRPYTACERGTNENHTKMLRRFFPKGCDFSKVSDGQVAATVSWMNNYLRRIHGGKTPTMIYEKCCDF